jgi:hypothetical protein
MLSANALAGGVTEDVRGYPKRGQDPSIRATVLIPWSEFKGPIPFSDSLLVS